MLDRKGFLFRIDLQLSRIDSSFLPVKSNFFFLTSSSLSFIFRLSSNTVTSVQSLLFLLLLIHQGKLELMLSLVFLFYSSGNEMVKPSERGAGSKTWNRRRRWRKWNWETYRFRERESSQFISYWVNLFPLFPVQWINGFRSSAVKKEYLILHLTLLNLSFLWFFHSVKVPSELSLFFPLL